MRPDKTRGIPCFVLNAAASALALVIAIVYAVYSASNDTFVPVVFVMLVLGVAGGVGVMLTDVPMLPLVPCAFWSLAFSFFLSNRLMMFGDYLNGLPGLSGGGNIIELVFFILIGTVLCVAAEIAICFMDTPEKRASRAN